MSTFTTPPRQRLQSAIRTKAKVVLKYTSPRCHAVNDDEEEPYLVPTDNNNTSHSLRHDEERWHHMSKLAGNHKQDVRVLDFTSRPNLSPANIKAGIPPRVASRIQELHLSIASDLPEWLDVISSLFFQLQHLYTTVTSISSQNTQDARMRRLYILYRLPDLISIDGNAVTEAERQLARPSSPNGHRVKREDWVSYGTNDDDDECSSSVASEEESEIQHHDGDAVEVNLLGVVKRVSADPLDETWDEPELLKPYEPTTIPSTTTITETETKSVTKTVHRSMSFQPSNTTSLLVSSTTTPTRTTYGNFRLLEQLGGGGVVGTNPCVRSRNTPHLDEPDTLDYYDTDQTSNNNNNSHTTALLQHRSQQRIKEQQNHSLGAITTRASQLPFPWSKDDLDSLVSSSPPPPPPPRRIMKAQQSPSMTTTQMNNKNHVSSPKNGDENHVSSPSSSACSLSSPFPMQFRSKSFNGAIMPRRSNGHSNNNNCGGGMRKEKSSPDLSPEENRFDDHQDKETIDSTAPLSPNNTTWLSSPNSKSSTTTTTRRADRPPTCPGARRVVPAETQGGRRRPHSSWRSKRSIRSTSIVDDDDDDDDDVSTEEEELLES